MFAIKNEIRLTPVYAATKVSAKERFPLAIIYPTGWINQGKIYEFVDFAPKDQDSLSDLLGLEIPKRIQFSCVPSHVTAVMGSDNFAAELKFNTVKYIHVSDSIKVLQKTDKGFLISEDEYEPLRDALLTCVSVSVSPETKQKYSADVIERSTNLISGALVNFWIGATGSRS